MNGKWIIYVIDINELKTIATVECKGKPTDTCSDGEKLVWLEERGYGKERIEVLFLYDLET